jgi:hypothetical protein
MTGVSHLRPAAPAQIGPELKTDLKTKPILK